MPRQPRGDAEAFGHGHTQGVRQGDTMTEEQADVLLRAELVRYEKDIDRSVRVELTQNMYDALVSFVYNIGPGNFWGSTMLKILNSRCYYTAAQEFLKWRFVTSGGEKVESAGLLKRREREKKLFLEGADAIA